MAQNLKTSGGYIEETNAFPNSVVEVETAVPAFIGYTEKAFKNDISVVNQPVRITSIAEYHLFFGGAFNPRFTLAPVDKGKLNKHEITLQNLDNSVDLNKLLPEFAARNLTANFKVDLNEFISALIQEKPNDLASALLSDNLKAIDSFVKDGKLIEGFSFETFSALEKKKI